MIFHLYQPRLNKDQARELNEGYATHSPYLSLSLLSARTNPFEKVAAAFGYYRHAADVEAGSTAAVFEITNIGPEELITRHGPMRSGSVGDVIIQGTRRTSKGYICCVFGWAEMTEDQVAEFQTQVSTMMSIADAE